MMLPLLLFCGGSDRAFSAWVETAWTGPHGIPRGRGLRKGLTAPSDISRLAQFLRAADWRVIYGLNMATSTPQVAEQEASAAHAALGNRLVAFEIGNEPDLYHGNGLRGRDYSYSDWLKEWKSYAEAISSGVPEAEYAGPAAATDLKGFTIPFSRDAAGKASLLTHHYYRADGRLSTSTVELLLSPDPRLPGLINGLADAARSQGIRGGFRLGEANSFFNGGAPHVSDTFASSLWAIDFLFECARGGAEGVNFHGGGESSGYTPIADDGRTVQAVRPEYYGIYLFSMAARGRMLTVNVSTGGNAVSAWAVAARDDSLRVVLLNRSDARPGPGGPAASRCATDRFPPASHRTVSRGGDGYAAQWLPHPPRRKLGQDTAGGGCRAGRAPGSAGGRAGSVAGGDPMSAPPAAAAKGIRAGSLLVASISSALHALAFLRFTMHQDAYGLPAEWTRDYDLLLLVSLALVPVIHIFSSAASADHGGRYPHCGLRGARASLRRVPRHPLHAHVRPASRPQHLLRVPRQRGAFRGGHGLHRGVPCPSQRLLPHHARPRAPRLVHLFRNRRRVRRSPRLPSPHLRPAGRLAAEDRVPERRHQQAHELQQGLPGVRRPGPARVHGARANAHHAGAARHCRPGVHQHLCDDGRLSETPLGQRRGGAGAALLDQGAGAERAERDAGHPLPVALHP